MFQRSNRLKYYFRDSVAQEVHPFRQKSTWMPPRASDDVEKYLQRIEKDMRIRTYKLLSKHDQS